MCAGNVAADAGAADASSASAAATTATRVNLCLITVILSGRYYLRHLLPSRTEYMAIPALVPWLFKPIYHHRHASTYTCLSGLMAANAERGSETVNEKISRR